MYLADHTWEELGDYFERESLALVPVGSTEQHGPHLPESTDHLIAEAYAREAAERTGYLCTPTVNVGVSPHHRQFHGTMWVDAPAFREYMTSLARNLTYHGVDRIVFVNAHGGNVEHLREVGRRLRDADDAYAVEWMWDESIPDLVDDLFEFNGPHGGPKETAMVQHLRPDLVREDRVEAARDDGVLDMEAAERQYRRNGSRTFYDSVENTDSGVFGDQTDATAEKGAELFEAATGQLVELCEWLAARDWSELRAPDHA
jgi:creatinine amidohydrolase